MTDKEYFNGRCPYTSKKCDDWNCSKCEVNKAELEFMEELDEEEENEV